MSRFFTKQMSFKCFLIFLFIGVSGFAQRVSVSQTANGSEELVYSLLDNACAEISNSAISTGNSVAHFNNNNGAFPLEQGVVIRTGDALHSAGDYTGNHLSDHLNTNTDPYLEAINAQAGQPTDLHDIAFLEFEFTPLSSSLNFDFIFASNEYGEWQCVSSDVFAFLLTDLTTGETTNLAVVPGTNTPISVKEIKDQTYNTTCGSDNPELFDSYQPFEENTVLNMRGYTKVMTASAAIEPGKPYKIRLVIADATDANFDSAIFLSGGSFDTGLDLGPDASICDGDSMLLETGLNSEAYQHTWFYNGQEINGENDNQIFAENPGEYSVQITQNSTNCSFADEIVISELNIGEPQNLSVCTSGAETYQYNLTNNNAEQLGLDPDVYALSYFASLEDLQANNQIPANQLENYESAGNQEIFIQINNSQNQASCTNTRSFQLLVNEGISISAPSNIDFCTFPEELTSVNLTQVISQLLSNENSYNFSFYVAENDALNQENAIETPQNYNPPENIDSQTIWVRVDNASNAACFAIESFDINKNPSPLVDSLPDVIECSAYILPEINNGSYFSESNGEGDAYFPGDIIDESGTYYIYNISEETGCSNQSSFSVILIEDFSIKEDHCGGFNVPSPPAGAFYTAPGGPNGNGEEILPGTAFYENTILHYYAEIDGQVCKDEEFPINILPLPEVDQPEDVVTCQSYTLPTLENGQYFSDSFASGQALAAGDEITSSTTVYIFNDDSLCVNEHAFDIIIIPDYQDVTACGDYTLPAVEVGGFYTQANGEGELFEPQEVITTSQTVYFYAETTTQPNCTLDNSFTVNITPLPEVDELEDVLLCENETYTLPALYNGNYFTEENANGTQLQAGDIIEQSQTIYIYNFANACSNQSSFEVEIRPLPPVENFVDMHVCEPYELPQLQYGRYFTQPHAEGTELFAGDLISSTQTIYIYAQYEDLSSCVKEDSFTVYFDGVLLPDFEDIDACVEYTLPELEKGNYFTESGGQGTQLFAGDVITSTQEIFVYSIVGTRFVCENERSFTININGLPDLSSFTSIESCGNYNLPEENAQGYPLYYYWDANEQEPLTNLNISQAGNYTLFVVAQDDTEMACRVKQQFSLHIYERPQLNINNTTLCRDVRSGEVIAPAVLTSGVDPNAYAVNWYFDGELVHSGPELQTEQPGVYTVETEMLSAEAGNHCNYAIEEVRVFESSQALINTEVTQPFEDIAEITVNVTKGYGNYKYQLNDGPWQYENNFYNVPTGVHTVKVSGITGSCGVTTTKVTVIKHPKYFTPNQDGINDTWNIADLKEHPNAKIYIFDRYGKLITGLKPNSRGWDGTLNNKNLPSNDYWFRVEFIYEGNKETYTSHITLKR